MSAINPEGLQSSLTADGSTDEAINTLVEVVKEQSEAITELQRESEQKDERIAELEEQLSEQQSESAKERAEIKQRVTTLEESDEPASGDETPTPETGKTASQEPETALEQVCALPEHVVQDNLTANQQRARSVARRIEEYGKKVPAGVAITSSRIKRVLTAQEDTTIHRQTVSRVADFLKQFGDGSVKIKETRGGKTTVVFDEKLVEDVTRVVTGDKRDGVTPAVV